MYKLARKFFILILGSLIVPQLFAQQPILTLSLQKAQQLARENYPLIKQKDLIRRAAFLTIENIQTSFLPQVNIIGQASYQSDVTSISIPLPGFNFSPLSKDQYKFWGELNQLIYDGGAVKNQKDFQTRLSMVEDQKTEVELYKLKDKINQLYLGLLLLDAQLVQANLVQENVLIGLKTVKAKTENGVAYKSAQWVLDAQLLQCNQKLIEVTANKNGLLRMMELFVQQSISDSVHLEMPNVQASIEAEILRPELQLFSFQDSLLKVQSQLIHSKSTPKLGLFGQAGYGKPGLNQLKNEFVFYGIGGLRVNWLLSNFYTLKREQKIVDVNRKINSVQQAVFILNTHTQLTQQQAEINKLNQLAKVDEQILAVREKITESSKAQLQNSVINSSDYLREINADDQARTILLLHRIQLIQAKINYQNIKGNQ